MFSLACAPVFLMPERYGLACMRAWSRVNSGLLATICGLRHEVRGTQFMPSGAALVAAKHQSAWETMALLHILPAPAVVMKKELLWLPLFGWYALKFRHLAVDRAGGPTALKRLLRQARAAAGRHRQIVIFPEGTRRAPGAPPAYQRGTFALYRDLKLPCVPVALNSGHFWPRRDWRRRPGTIVVEFLEPIPPGLNAPAFLAEMERRIETASTRIAAEAASEPAPGEAAPAPRLPRT